MNLPLQPILLLSVIALWFGLLIPTLTIAQFLTCLPALLSCFSWQKRWQGSHGWVILSCFFLGWTLAPGTNISRLPSIETLSITATGELQHIYAIKHGKVYGRARLLHITPLDEPGSLQKNALEALISQAASLPPIYLNFKLPSAENLLEDPEHVLNSSPLRGIAWQWVGTLKITATGKVRFKIAKASPRAGSTLKYYHLLFQLHWREFWAGCAHRASPRGANLLLAMVGATSSSAAVDYTLKRMGLAHLTAISGIHFTLLNTMLRTSLLALPWSGRSWPSLVTWCSSLFFLLAIEPTPSAWRAWIMNSLALFCLSTRRNYQVLQGLTVAVLGFLILKPTWAYDLGFTLSVWITAILIALIPFLRSPLPKLSRFYNVFITTVALQGGIMFFSLPLQLYAFQQINGVSLLANLTAAPLIVLLFQATWLCLPLTLAYPPLGKNLFQLLAYVAQAILDALSDIPHAYDHRIVWGGSHHALIALVSFALVALIYLLLNPPQTPPTTLPSPQESAAVSHNGP